MGFQDLYEQLLGAMLSSEPGSAAAFTRSLQHLSDYAAEHDLNAALADPRNTPLVLWAWRQAAHAGRVSRRAPHLPAPNVADALSVSNWLSHLLRPLGHAAEGCDLLHVTSNGLAALPALATQRRFGTPFILTEHGIYLRERYLTPPSSHLTPGTRAVLLRFYLQLTRAAYRQATVISPASSFNVRWQLHLGADPRKLQPVYNGIDPDLFTRGESEPPSPTVAWVGRVDPIKDLTTLIRAHALVQRRVPTAQLRMYGPVPTGNEDYARACRHLIASLGLADAATFEGRVPSVVQAYHAGHVVALSSISEGFPYTVLEAMATGRPVVATDVGGVREAVGDTGLVVPPKDPGAFAQACEALLRDHHLREHLGRQARERVLSLFTVDRCVRAYRHMYQALGRPAASLSGGQP